MRHYLAIARLPGVPPDRVRASLEELAVEAKRVGLRPVETLFDRRRRSVYTLVDAADAESVRNLHEAAGLGEADVFEVERIFTELLGEPRRERFA